MEGVAPEGFLSSASGGLPGPAAPGSLPPESASGGLPGSAAAGGLPPGSSASGGLPGSAAGGLPPGSSAPGGVLGAAAASDPALAGLPLSAPPGFGEAPPFRGLVPPSVGGAGLPPQVPQDGVVRALAAQWDGNNLRGSVGTAPAEVFDMRQVMEML